MGTCTPMVLRYDGLSESSSSSLFHGRNGMIFLGGKIPPKKNNCELRNDISDIARSVACCCYFFIAFEPATRFAFESPPALCALVLGSSSC